jgi:hypothetical protein
MTIIRNSNNIPALKADDSKNRRQESRPATCLHDMLCARYYTIDGSDARYQARYKPQDKNDVLIYSWDEEIKLIGYAKPKTKSKIKFTIHQYGCHWESTLALSKITCWGHKNPEDHK